MADGDVDSIRHVYGTCEKRERGGERGREMEREKERWREMAFAAKGVS